MRATTIVDCVKICGGFNAPTARHFSAGWSGAAAQGLRALALRLVDPGDPKTLKGLIDSAV